LVSRLGGVAESDYSHGKGDFDLNDYAVYNNNSGSKVVVVGLKKPVFYNGKAIYDLHGNVWKWIEDWYDGNLPVGGGIDPQGSTTGIGRVVRGGCWGNAAKVLHSGYRTHYNSGYRGFNVGFRLVRTTP
jgi:formylglycine-generating enzyme required for sulfatase activity